MVVVKEAERQKHGDMIFIGVNEKFAWEGEMELFIANAPGFEAGQYKEVD
ncbi:MAG: hypothetical protein PHW76_00030 [Alphaproteobacteria bacterium]|nr:hypothetical protein [Alphaproteobacteria bacterium]